jgi:hypothetical protein
VCECVSVCEDLHTTTDKQFFGSIIPLCSLTHWWPCSALPSHTLVAMQCFALSHTGGHAVLCPLTHWWPRSALPSHTLVAMQCFALSHTGGHAVLCPLTHWWPRSASKCNESEQGTGVGQIPCICQPPRTISLQDQWAIHKRSLNQTAPCTIRVSTLHTRSIYGHKQSLREGQ